MSIKMDKKIGRSSVLLAVYGKRENSLRAFKKESLVGVGAR